MLAVHLQYTVYDDIFGAIFWRCASISIVNIEKCLAACRVVFYLLFFINKYSNISCENESCLHNPIFNPRGFLGLEIKGLISSEFSVGFTAFK